MAKRKRPKEATLDALFSQVVRERDDYKCRVCHKDFRHDPGRLHCSHHIGRARRVVRFDLDNASSKCADCHRRLDLNPLEHAEWVKQELGEERYEDLKERANGLWKATDADRRDLAKELREQLKAYRERRAQGERGRL